MGGKPQFFHVRHRGLSATTSSLGSLTFLAALTKKSLILENWHSKWGATRWPGHTQRCKIVSWKAETKLLKQIWSWFCASMSVSAAKSINVCGTLRAEWPNFKISLSAGSLIHRKITKRYAGGNRSGGHSSRRRRSGNILRETFFSKINGKLVVLYDMWRVPLGNEPIPVFTPNLRSRK